MTCSAVPIAQGVFPIPAPGTGPIALAVLIALTVLAFPNPKLVPLGLPDPFPLEAVGAEGFGGLILPPVDRTVGTSEELELVLRRGKGGAIVGLGPKRAPIRR
jgi:hypothetical protein